MNKFLLPFLCVLFGLTANSSISQDCEQILDSVYFELVAFNNAGIDGGDIAEGSNFRLEVRTVNFQLSSFQYTIQFDPSKLEFVNMDVSANNLEGAVSFNANTSDEGLISVIWTNENGVGQILDDGTLLYSVTFKSKVQEKECLPVTMSNTGADMEIGLANIPGFYCYSTQPNNFLVSFPMCLLTEGDDFDQDGYASPEDCDDMNPNINPGQYDFCDGIDNNCDGVIDEGYPMITQYADMDDDGYGDPDTETIFCEVIFGMVDNPDDCDDTNPDVNPGMNEICDGIDNNCDGEIDEGFTLTAYYFDADNDSYGDASNSMMACETPAGYTRNNDDCDDQDPNINPAAPEVAGNDIDENCDGVIGTSSIDEFGNLAVKIYPNPASDFINIDVLENHKLTLSLFDINGRCLLTKEQATSLDLATYSNGVYLLKITDQLTAESIIERIVVSK